MASVWSVFDPSFGYMAYVFVTVAEDDMSVTVIYMLAYELRIKQNT